MISIRYDPSPAILPKREKKSEEIQMKNETVKKLMMALLTGTLCVGMTMAAYAAPAGGRPMGQGGQMQGQPPKDGQQMGQPPQGELPGGFEEGEMPELPEGVEAGERPELPEGVEEGERPELPEGVSENDAQKVGRPMGKNGERPDGERPKMEKPEGELPEGALNIGAYRTALETIDDEDTKASLQEYIYALEDALEAEKTALDSEDELTEEEMDEYRQAVEDASEALAAAFEDAGIEVDDEMPKPDEDELPAGAAGNKHVDKAQKDEVLAESAAKNDVQTTAQSAGGSDTKAAASSEKKNVLAGKLSDIYNWLKGLFG